MIYVRYTGWQINVYKNQKTYQFKLGVKDDKYDALKAANITVPGAKNFAKLALTCYGGSTHERL
jgi:hypothetical protein